MAEKRTKNLASRTAGVQKIKEANLHVSHGGNAIAARAENAFENVHVIGAALQCEEGEDREVQVPHRRLQCNRFHPHQ